MLYLYVTMSIYGTQTFSKEAFIMQLFKYILCITLSSLFLIACASSTPKELDAKYIFPNLKQVDRVFSNRIDSWGDIDKQSLFLSTSPSTSYLVILKRPSNDIGFARNMSFSSTGSSLDAKFDRIYFSSSTDSIDPIPAYIERIYQVKGKEQRKLIRSQILKPESEKQTTPSDT